MGIFVPNQTNCYICWRNIETLGKAVSFPHLDASGIAGRLSDGFAHRECALAAPAANDIRCAWSRHWHEQALVFDPAAVVLEDVIAFRKRARVVLVSCAYLFVIEEMKSAMDQLVRALEEPRVASVAQGLPLNCYTLTDVGDEVTFVVTTHACRPAADDRSKAIVEEVLLLDLRVASNEWMDLATSLRNAARACSDA